MTWEHILSRIKTNLHQPASGGNWTDAEYLRTANEIMGTVVDETNCMTSDTLDSAVLNQTEYAIPVTSARIISIGFKSSTDVDFIPLERTSIEQLEFLDKEGKIPSPWRNESDTPVAWYSRGAVFGLYPKPDANGTNNIKIYFDEIATEMTTTVSEPFNGDDHLVPYHIVIVYGVTGIYLDMLGENSAMWMGRYEQIKRAMKKKLGQTEQFSFPLVNKKRGITRSIEWPLGI